MSARTAPVKHEQRREELKQDAATLGHTADLMGSWMIGPVCCSCGWKHTIYEDGTETPMEAWEKHARTVVEIGQGELPLSQCLAR